MMKAQTIVGIMLVLMAGQRCPCAENHLHGCQAPEVLSKALTKLQQSNWNKISFKHVLSMWPSQLQELKCDSEGGCRILLSQDRIVSGHCECCEAFEFDVDTNQDLSRGEHLSNIIFHYSDPDRNYVIDAAKRMAIAAGLPQEQLPAIGRKRIDRYDWDDERPAVRQSYTLEVHVTKVGQNWELYFYILAGPL